MGDIFGGLAELALGHASLVEAQATTRFGPMPTIGSAPGPVPFSVARDLPGLTQGPTPALAPVDLAPLIPPGDPRVQAASPGLHEMFAALSAAAGRAVTPAPPNVSAAPHTDAPAPVMAAPVVDSRTGQLVQPDHSDAARELVADDDALVTGATAPAPSSTMALVEQTVAPGLSALGRDRPLAAGPGAAVRDMHARLMRGQVGGEPLAGDQLLEASGDGPLSAGFSPPADHTQTTVATAAQSPAPHLPGGQLTARPPLASPAQARRSLSTDGSIPVGAFAGPPGPEGRWSADAPDVAASLQPAVSGAASLTIQRQVAPGGGPAAGLAPFTETARTVSSAPAGAPGLASQPEGSGAVEPMASAPARETIDRAPFGAGVSGLDAVAAHTGAAQPIEPGPDVWAGASGAAPVGRPDPIGPADNPGAIQSPVPDFTVESGSLADDRPGRSSATVLTEGSGEIATRVAGSIVHDGIPAAIQPGRPDDHVTVRTGDAPSATDVRLEPGAAPLTGAADSAGLMATVATVITPLAQNPSDPTREARSIHGPSTVAPANAFARPGSDDKALVPSSDESRPLTGALRLDPLLTDTGSGSHPTAGQSRTSPPTPPRTAEGRPENQVALLEPGNPSGEKLVSRSRFGERQPEGDASPSEVREMQAENDVLPTRPAARLAESRIFPSRTAAPQAASFASLRQPAERQPKNYVSPPDTGELQEASLVSRLKPVEARSESDVSPYETGHQRRGTPVSPPRAGEGARSIRVTIGRIDVRTAPASGGQPAARRSPARPAPSLADYLKGSAD
jgi:hypothetical protein